MISNELVRAKNPQGIRLGGFLFAPQSLMPSSFSRLARPGPASCADSIRPRGFDSAVPRFALYPRMPKTFPLRPINPDTNPLRFDASRVKLNGVKHRIIRARGASPRLPGRSPNDPERLRGKGSRPQPTARRGRLDPDAPRVGKNFRAEALF